MRSIAFLLSLLLLTGCNALNAGPDRPAPLPQEKSIQVYFNHDRSRGDDYTDPYRKISRSGDNLEAIILENINSARRSIDVAVQELRLPEIATALVKRHREGIKVRVILENSYNRSIASLKDRSDKMSDREQERLQNLFDLVDSNRDGKLSPEEIDTRDAIAILQKGGVPVIDDTADRSRGSGLMHHKFTIIDDDITLVSSANYTLSDIHGDFSNPKTVGNANHLLVIKNPQLARAFQREFDIMWGTDGEPKFGTDKPYRKPQTITIDNSTVTVKFSPNAESYPWNISTNGAIGDTLSTATKSVDLALFVFTEQKLADILENRHDKGVKIRVLIDPGFAFRDYSEGLDLLGVAYPKKCRYEKDNNPWKNPIDTVGVPRLEAGDKLHHKFGLIDNRIVITGSHNWSRAANSKNDETLLIIENPTIAAHFSREFQNLYRTASLGLPDTIKEKIEAETKRCR
ncbi:phospholipase D-like domain-containing protein [Pannus brasiliensis CCIBt3594]|uniref:phospholipase D n=1 Tax=Pannus brasiliensis CCIBt3594 TaxID=1427578 RepID=A0AAW9QT32_9CHRO